MTNYNFSEQAIAEAAYYIWKNNGCPANSSMQDWNAAINQLSLLANSKKTKLSSAKKTSSCKTLTATKKSPAKKSAKKSK